MRETQHWRCSGGLWPPFFFSGDSGAQRAPLQELAHYGRRAITGDTALRLAHFFGTTAEFWLNLQSLYEVRLAERKSGKAIKALPTLKRFEEARA